MTRALALLALCCCAAPLQAGQLTRTIATVKESVVGVGTYLKTRSPATTFSGTGFIVDDGLSVITNAHVVPENMDTEHQEALGIVIARGSSIEFRPAVLVALDRAHDLAHLRISGAPLPALKLGDSANAVEGQELALTGFPLGMVLGLHPATHRALLSAITPIVMPSLSSRALDVKQIAAAAAGAILDLPARRHGVSGQQRQPGLRPRDRHRARGHQHDLRQGAQGKRDHPSERHRLRHSGQLCS